MIVNIQGKILEKGVKNVVIETGGLGYLCHISLNTYDKLPKMDDNVFLLTYHHITEHSQELFAFIDKLEKELFILLISVSGIGPKTAINLLSAVTPNEFKRRLIASEVSMLSDLPGIGPKTARRIIVELKDKFVNINKDGLPLEQEDLLTDQIEAVQALQALGYKTQNINNVIRKIISNNPDLNTQNLIKESLKKLK